MLTGEQEVNKDIPMIIPRKLTYAQALKLKELWEKLQTGLRDREKTMEVRKQQERKGYIK